MNIFLIVLAILVVFVGIPVLTLFVVARNPKILKVINAYDKVIVKIKDIK